MHARLPISAPPPAQSRHPRHPKNHTHGAHKPRTKNHRAASAKQNHTFCWAKPYVSCSKTIPFAHQNHTFRITTSTLLMLNNLHHAPREQLPAKRKWPKKTRGNLDRRKEKRTFASTKQLFPNGTLSPSTPRCVCPRRIQLASCPHHKAMPSTASAALGGHHHKHRHGVHPIGIAQRPSARRATCPLTNRCKQSWHNRQGITSANQ